MTPSRIGEMLVLLSLPWVNAGNLDDTPNMLRGIVYRSIISDRTGASSGTLPGTIQSFTPHVVAQP